MTADEIKKIAFATCETVSCTCRRYGSLSSRCGKRGTVAILATLDAIRELPAEITDSSASTERDFAIRWYSRIDALKREIAA